MTQRSKGTEKKMRNGMAKYLLILILLNMSHLLANTVTYEAEDAVLSGPVVVGNYVDYIHANNDYIEWTVNATQAGQHTLDIRYALGYGERPLELKVNGSIVEASLAFASTGSWNNYENVTVAVNLNSGTNTVRTTAIGFSGPNVDALIVTFIGTTPPPPTPQNIVAEQGQVTADHNWAQVDFTKSFNDPVVLCTPIYQSTHAPVVPRVQLFTDHFKVRLTNADGTTSSISPITVNYFIIEKGLYTELNHGVNMEVLTMPSTFVDYKFNYTGQSLILNNTYSNAIVLGQIITANDSGDDYQTFWSETQTNGTIKVGRHVGEDPDTTRENETIGVLVIEEGEYIIGNSIISAGKTGVAVEGIPATPTTVSTPLLNYVNALFSINSLEGQDGVFPVITSLSNEELKVAIDEDTINDSERNHTQENLSFIAFSNEVPPPTFNPSSNPILFGSSGGLVNVDSAYGGTIHYTLNYNNPTIHSDIYTGSIEFDDDATLKAIVSIDGFAPSSVAETEIKVTEVIGTIQPGILITKLNWPYGDNESYTFDTVPLLSSTAKSKEKKVQDLGQINMGKYKTFKVDFYLDITEENDYTFYLSKSNNAAAKLYINNLKTPRISQGVVTSGPTSFTIHLEQGMHEIRIEAINSIFNGWFALEYESASIPRGSIPSSKLFYSVDLEVDDIIDSDGDGLLNSEEGSLGTDKYNTDTDSDGLSDYDEVNEYSTNPLQADSDLDGINDFLEAVVFHSLTNDQLGNIVEIQTINPAATSSIKGRWKVDGNELQSKSYRGEVSYGFNLAQNDMPLLKIVGKEGGEYPKGRGFDLALWVDETYIGRQTLQSKSDYVDDGFGMTFEGPITIDEADTYTFYTESDDGSQLFINGNLVVDNDGKHGMITKSGQISLGAGTHRIKVTYFHHSGSEGMNIFYSNTSFLKTEIPASVLGDLNWKYFEGTWNVLPDFDALTPLKTGVSHNFEIGVRKGALSGEVFFLLPWLNAGNHNIRILWDNGIYSGSLRLQNITISEVQGVDADSDNVKDWINQKLDNECTVEIPSSTKISPLCIEGKGLYTSLMNVSSEEIVNQSAGSRWYINKSLSSTGTTNFSVGFQNGVKNIQSTVNWEATDIYEENSSLKIRVNDSLLLNPFPTGETGSATIIIDNGITAQNFTVTGTKVHQFTIAGSYEVTASFSGYSPRTIQVDVIELDLPDNNIVGLVGSERKIELPINHDVVYENDPRLFAWYKTDTVNGSNQEYAISIDKQESRHIVARIGDDGPILNTIAFKGMKVFGVGQTWLFYGSTLSDGSREINLGIVGYSLEPDVELRAQIYVPGVLFETGDVNHTYTLSDFNDISEIAARLYKTSSSTQTAACHHLDVYQNNKFVGRAY